MSLSSLAFGSEHNEICGGGRAFLELSSVRWCVSLPFFGILISVAGPHGGKRVHCSCLTAGRSTIFCFEPFMYSRSVGGFFFEYSWFPSRHAGLGECFTWNWAEVWVWVWMGCLYTSPSDGLVNPALPSPAGTVSQIIKTNGFEHFEIHLPQFNC